MAPAAADPGGRPPPGRLALAGWVLFDCACQPFFSLVTTFVFAPYFAAALAGDPVRGQTLWGYATAAAGLCLTVLSPVLGSVADATGRMKPWIGTSCAVLALGAALLWFAAPGASYAIPLALASFAVATVAAEVAAVFNNAMMSHLVGPQQLGRLSGIGWSVGYAGGLLSMLLVLGFMAASPETGQTVLGHAPILGLDPKTHAGDRASGPLSALWLLLFVWPLFALTPDAKPAGTGLGEAVREGLRNLKSTLDEARGRPELGLFLLANMVYQDGLVALFSFGGIYGAGVFGWSTTELGIFGILLTVAGMIGAFVGGFLDDRVGAKAIILLALAVLVAVCHGILSLGRDHVLFVVAAAPPSAGDGIFTSVPERIFVGLGLVLGLVAGPLQASSRSYLARVVPAEDAGRYFGLLALSGKLTSFLAPLAVALATALTGTQAAAPAVLIAFFIVGAAIMTRAHSAGSGEPVSAGSGGGR